MPCSQICDTYSTTKEILLLDKSNGRLADPKGLPFYSLPVAVRIIQDQKCANATENWERICAKWTN